LQNFIKLPKASFHNYIYIATGIKHIFAASKFKADFYCHSSFMTMAMNFK